MDIYVIPVISILLFCFCLREFTKALIFPINRLAAADFSVTALKVKRTYKVFSWGLMSGVFLMGLVVSFYQVYTLL